MRLGEGAVQVSFQDRLLARGGCRSVGRLSREPICCDAADQKQESRRDAAETDGRREMRAQAHWPESER